MTSLRIVVTGLIGHYPLGGMTWHYLQFVLGLARLGHDVYYLEDMGSPPYSPLEGGLGHDCSFNVRYLSSALGRVGLGGRWAYRCPVGPRWLGLPDRTREEVIHTADLLVNVSGSLGRPEDYRAVPTLAYVDTDPVFTHVKLARGDAPFRAQVDLHDVHFSFGERLSSAVPATGHEWRPTRQPVVLSEWRPSTPRRRVFTTVMSWNTRYQPVAYDGRSFGQKDIELRRFLDLPRLVKPAVLELALHAGKRRQAPFELLASRGWRIADPRAVCHDLDGYRSYVESSLAEWSVAKHGYVEGRAGWFSERSACYLAAGRPVVAQDTGFSAVLPTGEGLLAFTTADDAAAAIEEVERDHAVHSRAARDLAEECFDSAKVLTRLVEQASAGDRTPSGPIPVAGRA